MAGNAEILSVRDAIAHCLQLCDYIEDCDSSPKDMIDWPMMVQKAKQVRKVLMEKGPRV